MTEANILALTTGVNDCEIMIDGEVNGQPAILSTKIADRFNKKHCNILRDIDALQSILPQSFVAENFKLVYFDVPGPNGAIRKARAYLLTRDAFSLLVMGMTGKAAVIWKLRYIEAFNALEKAALESHAAQAREAGYQEALKLPALEAERKKGYLAGLAEGKKLAKKEDRLYVLERLICYARARLSHEEMGRCLGISKNSVQKRIASFKKKGYWPKDITPVQASLPGVM